MIHSKEPDDGESADSSQRSEEEQAPGGEEESEVDDECEYEAQHNLQAGQRKRRREKWTESARRAARKTTPAYLVLRLVLLELGEAERPFTDEVDRQMDEERCECRKGSISPPSPLSSTRRETHGR